MTVKEMRAALGLSQKAFAEKYHIPRRTVENWEADGANYHNYVLELLERAVIQDLNEQNKTE